MNIYNTEREEVLTVRIQPLKAFADNSNAHRLYNVNLCCCVRSNRCEICASYVCTLYAVYIHICI